jgi:hypothetical protein
VLIYAEGALRVTDRSWSYGLKRYPLGELYDPRLERGAWSGWARRAMMAGALAVIGTAALGLFAPRWIVQPAQLWWPGLAAAALFAVAGIALRRQPRSYLLTARRGPVRVVLLASHWRHDVEEAAEVLQIASFGPAAALDGAEPSGAEPPWSGTSPSAADQDVLAG